MPRAEREHGRSKRSGTTACDHRGQTRAAGRHPPAPAGGGGGGRGSLHPQMLKAIFNLASTKSEALPCVAGGGAVRAASPRAPMAGLFAVSLIVPSSHSLASGSKGSSAGSIGTPATTETTASARD